MIKKREWTSTFFILSRICQKSELTNSVLAFYGAKNVRMSESRRSGDGSLEKLHLWFMLKCVKETGILNQNTDQLHKVKKK